MTANTQHPFLVRLHVWFLVWHVIIVRAFLMSPTWSLMVFCILWSCLSTNPHSSWQLYLGKTAKRVVIKTAESHTHRFLLSRTKFIQAVFQFQPLVHARHASDSNHPILQESLHSVRVRVTLSDFMLEFSKEDFERDQMSNIPMAKLRCASKTMHRVYIGMAPLR